MKEFETPTLMLTNLSLDDFPSGSNEFPFMPVPNSTDTNDLGIIQLN